MQLLFVSIFIFSRTVSSLMPMDSYFFPQLLYYIYSFYINLSFNDVNDFIFRFSPCTLLNINPMIFPLYINTHTHTHFFSSCFRLFLALAFLSFSCSRPFSPVFFLYIIHDFSVNIFYL